MTRAMTTTPEQRAEWARLVRAAMEAEFPYLDDALMRLSNAALQAIPVLLADVETLTAINGRYQRAHERHLILGAEARERAETAEAKVAALEAEVARLNKSWTTAMLAKNEERERADIAESQLATVRAETWEAAVKIADDQRRRDIAVVRCLLSAGCIAAALRQAATAQEGEAGR
jgi:hypothetical protein